jgi:hypothetical protein
VERRDREAQLGSDPRFGRVLAEIVRPSEKIDRAVCYSRCLSIIGTAR